jgi:hypothetical protein
MRIRRRSIGEGPGPRRHIRVPGAQGRESRLLGGGSRTQEAGQSYRFVVFGDCGAGTAAQKAVAYQANLARPDFVMITGDIVYARGRISEYHEKFWPVHNAADEASLLLGAPLLRSTLFVADVDGVALTVRQVSAEGQELDHFIVTK